MLFLIAILPACEKTESPPSAPPASTPVPIATPTPTPIPTPATTPEPTPVARLAPEGILYVQEEISITTESGIRRLSAGKEVQVIREEGDMVTVKDGDLEISAPMFHFTRDMDVRDALAAKRVELQKLAASASQQKKAQFEAEQAALQKLEAAAASQQAKAQTAGQIAALRKAISEWDARISKAQKERNERGSSRGSGNYGYRDRVTSLSADASQIDSLIEARDKLRAQLRQLESQR